MLDADTAVKRPLGLKESDTGITLIVHALAELLLDLPQRGSHALADRRSPYRETSQSWAYQGDEANTSRRSVT